MPITRLTTLLLASAAAIGLALPSLTFAQPTPAPMRVRATIDKVDGNVLALRTRDGRELTVALTPDVKVVGVSKTDIAAIKPGSFIGCASVPGPDGVQKALEVTVFPPSMNGTGEGSYAWDLGSNSTMTNGTVGDLVVSEGRIMTVKYNGNGSGEKKILVPEDVPIVNLQPADTSLLVTGAHVIVVPAKAADGTLTAGRINVGMNGTVPPM